jgi:hypothetical protein
VVVVLNHGLIKMNRLRAYTTKAAVHRSPVGFRLRRYSEQAATPEWWKKLTKKLKTCTASCTQASVPRYPDEVESIFSILHEYANGVQHVSINVLHLLMSEPLLGVRLARQPTSSK